MGGVLRAATRARVCGSALAVSISILAGVVAFAYTGMTALVLLMFIAVWAIIIGALQLYAAVQLRKVIENEWLLVLSGLLSIAFGAVLIAWPSTDDLVVCFLLGCIQHLIMRRALTLSPIC